MSSIKEYKCEFCGCFQTTKSNLKQHQQTAKKCIQIQKSRGVQVETPLSKCQYCNGEYSALNLKQHVERCPKKIVQAISNINGDSNNVNINIDNSINNITNNHITLDFGKFFTDEKVSEIFQEYKSEHALEQMKGLAKFIIEKVLLLEDSPGYYVKDVKRNIFGYETENGIKTDQNGELLRKKIKDGAGDHINDIVDKIIQDFSSLNNKKSNETVQDMKGFKKDIRELHITHKLMNKIKGDYTCKNKDERAERIINIKDSENKAKSKLEEAERIKKIEDDRQAKIKNYKFNIDKDRKNYVLSKGSENEPLSFSDKSALEELGLKYTDFFLEELM